MYLLHILLLTYSLEFGYLPDGMTSYRDPYQTTRLLLADDPKKVSDQFFYEDIQTKISYKWFSVGGELNVVQTPLPGTIRFNPIKSTFIVNAAFKLSNVEIGLQHACIHPIVSTQYLSTYNFAFSQYEKIYIKIGNI